MNGVEKVYYQGQKLFKQGELGGELFFIKKGKVELQVRSGESDESAVIATMGDRSVLGVMTFLEGEPRNATAVALEKTECTIIDQVQREKLLRTIPVWFKVLVKDLSTTLRKITTELTEYKTNIGSMETKYNVMKTRLEKVKQEQEEAKKKFEEVETKFKAFEKQNPAKK